MKIKNNLYMFESKTNSLLYVNKNDCFLIDPGKSKKMKEEIQNFILQNNLNLKAIINTHSHSDHVSNNDINDCKTIYASDVEKTIVENPSFQLDILYGGKHPDFFENSFLASNSFKTEPLKTLPNIEYINLAGHSYNMIGVLIEKDVLYIGDALFSEEELQGIPYLYDVCKFVDSLKKLEQYKNITIISSHIGVIDNIDNLIKSNIDFINKLVNDIIDFCNEEKSFDEIFEYVCKRRCIELNLVNYFLILSTIKNFISYLIDKKLLELIFKNYNLHYKTKKAT